MVKINTSGSPELQAVMDAIKGRTFDSEEEYREFVRNNDPPDGHVWIRSPFAEQGKWKLGIAEESEAKFTETGLEKELKSLLKDWGYWKRFEHDYRLSDGRQIDFADTENKVALEPGAAYWHSPDACKGDTKAVIGERPDEVYSPVTDSDMRKQETLRMGGWQILWITEDGVKKKPQRVKNWLEQKY